MFLIKKLFKPLVYPFKKSKPITPIEDNYVNINKKSSKNKQKQIESFHESHITHENLKKVIKKIKNENRNRSNTTGRRCRGTL